MTDRDGAPGAMLVVISGPSGVGKDAILDVLRSLPGNAHHHYVVTCTTRGRRPGEIDGVSYHFLEPRDFLALRDAGGLLEANEVHGNWYRDAPRPGGRGAGRGPPRDPQDRRPGRRRGSRRVPDALLIFVAPPSIETLVSRLTSRATETAEELAVRQRNAAAEMARQKDYDYVVINETGQLDRTAERISEIIALERARHAERRVRI